MTRSLFPGLLLTAVLGVTPATAQPAHTMDAAEIRQALDKLEVVGSAMYIAAHPDDENTAMLSWLSSGRDVRTAYLALTRGDGGQNLIGDEIGPALGVIRTRELLAARSIDGAEQFFTRAVDFGYSKTAEETFAKWGHDEVLRDVVWVIRSFRPDILITRFPPTSYAGHGHHTASAVLALEAFRAAADPKAFPEQLTHVAPWQPKRIMWNAWNPEQPESLIPVDLGEYDALLGRSYTEIAGASRSMHKSQGFGAAERRGSLLNHLRVDAGAPATADPFEGIELTWARVPGGAAIIPAINAIQSSYDEMQPSAIVPQLIDLRSKIAAIDHPDARFELEEIDEIIRSASGLWLEAISPTASTTHGSTLSIEATAIGRTAQPVVIRDVTLLASDGSALVPVASFAASSLPARLEPNAPLTLAAEIEVPPSLPLSNPYWLRGRDAGSTAALYEVESLELLGRPVGPPPFAVQFDVQIGDETIRYLEPVQYRTVDRVRGEIYELTRIVPEVSVTFADSLLVFVRQSAREIALTLENNTTEAESGLISLVPPEGWRISPQSISFTLAKGQRQDVRFSVTPPESTSVASIEARITRDGVPSEAHTVRRIDYEHIPPQVLTPEAIVRVVRADIEISGDRIGYIQGSGDDGPFALREMGYEVTLLDDQTIARGDLSEFDAIVVGVRAFNAREAAKQNVSRLHEYARNGGTVVVQYHTADRTLTDFAPVDLKLGRGRVTVEEAAVTPVLPEHPLLNEPNEIGTADFQGWVQERGLYFAETWDPSWEAPLASADPGETSLRGGLLHVPYGEGHFIYTGYSFFRQIPAGVPGALRLFANLVSIGAGDAR